ncbi:MarR family winged helix-turn-helix transcriptional regulator [Dubosiella newyorkensis]|uniref:MarR family transcriptional regulator n=1 Tax=Dubosiella newyorkensis TaxID=1862672 RepID=A0A1U7NQ45_9FIRM|nr:MarR family transcriptional regulator [Dubosiella newyorkensis]OLU47754.1 MarR family transcriptional regulator [Dubosiella newyorkensis]
MELETLIHRFSDTTENQEKAIFSSIFILGNKLQAIFDQHIPDLTLKQFMLLSLVRQANEPMSLSQYGLMLGCSRQNVKKLAKSLEQKGFVTLGSHQKDPRALQVFPTSKVEIFFKTSFFQYQEDLKSLFEVYTPQEIEALFTLLSKLYIGIEHLEKETKQ